MLALGAGLGWGHHGVLRPARAAASTAAGNRLLRVALAQPQALTHLPLVLAQVLGFFETEGVSLQWVPSATEGAALQAVEQGQADVAACAYGHMLDQHKRGADWQAFLLQLRAPQVVLGVSLKTLAHYRSPADLKGRRVGVLASVSPGHMVLGSVMQASGLNPGDVSLVALPSADELLVRYRAGALDALSASDPLVTLLEQRGEIRVLADTRSVHGTQELLGGPVPGMALCAPTAWLLAQTELAQAASYAVVRSLKWLQTAGPADLLKAVPEALIGPDRALYLAAFEKARGAVSPNGMLDASAVRAAFNVHARLDRALLGAGIVLERTYTNRFAEKAKSRFRV